MKNLILLILCGIFTTTAFSQQSLFNYQAVARDDQGRVIGNRDIALRFSIFEDDVQQTLRYVETHSVTTSDLGIFNVIIGDGNIQQGQFSDIQWEVTDFAMNVEMDIDNGTNYTDMGVVRLLSVPYALHAATVSDKDDADADPNNEIQELSRNNNTITLSKNGGSFTDETEDADADPNNEIQTLSVSGSQLTISGGNTVNLPTGGGGGSMDDDPNNEIQDLSSTKNGNTIDLNISLGGNGTTLDISDNDNDATNELQMISSDRLNNVVTLELTNGNQTSFEVQDEDADASNEVQSLMKNGNMITLSLNGGSVVDEVNDADADPANELQELELNGSSLSLSNGNSVDIQNAGYWKYNANDNALEHLTYDHVRVKKLKLNDDIAEIDVSNSSGTAHIIPNGITINNGAGQSSFLQGGSIEMSDGGTAVSLNSEGLDVYNGSLGEGVRVTTEEVAFTDANNGAERAAYRHNEMRMADFATKDSVKVDSRKMEFNSELSCKAIYSKDSVFISNQTIQDASGQAKLKYNSFHMGLENRVINMSAFETKNESFEVPEEKQFFSFTADSLNFLNGDSGSGQKYATSKMNHHSVELKDHFEDNSGCLSSNEMCLLTPYGDAKLTSYGLTLTERISPQDEWNRIALYPGGLQMTNDAKWNNVFLGDHDDKAGILRLDNGTGLGRIASLGANPNGFLPTEGGNLQLYYRDSEEPMVWLDGSYGYGEFCLYNKNQNCEFQLNASNAFHPGAYMSLADSIGEDRVFAYVQTVQSLFGPGYTKGVVKVEGDVLGGLMAAYYEDTLYSSMDNLGIQTEGSIGVNRERRIKDEVLSLFDYSILQYTGEWDEGVLRSRGPEETINVEITTSAADDIGFNADYGAIYVYDDEDIRRAGMEVRQADGLGVVWADVKNFRIDHPEDEDKEIVYASLEGPEAAAYSRGTSTLNEGKVFVAFPEHFRHVANPETMTIQLTPLYANTIGLAVVEKTTEGFWVQERMDGTGSFEFDWQATCVRKGYENFEVIRNKKMISPSK